MTISTDYTGNNRFLLDLVCLVWSLRFSTCFTGICSGFTEFYRVFLWIHGATISTDYSDTALLRQQNEFYRTSLCSNSSALLVLGFYRVFFLPFSFRWRPALSWERRASTLSSGTATPTPTSHLPKAPNPTVTLLQKARGTEFFFYRVVTEFFFCPPPPPIEIKDLALWVQVLRRTF